GTSISTKWRAPSNGLVKCNYDASHHRGNNDSGLGWIIRNCNGTFLDAGMGKFQGRHSPEESECSALIWALQSAWSLGYRKVEFEGDNLIINQLINNNRSNERLYHYLRLIHNWRSMFDTIKFTHRRRDSNNAQTF
ncbi:hypothetical protein EUTSA_v10003059mg, partial [Eutrema salsugineum]